MRKYVAALMVSGVVVVLAEVAARYAGVIDFPIYLADNRTGYIPAPSQAGAFMRKNNWAINNLSMGVAEDFSDGTNDILLVGDSIVWGGNPYRQDEKLPAQVQAAIVDRGGDAKVWPISAGSWGIVNEANWIEDHPDVSRAAETMIFVLNSADFDKPSSWSNPTTHPRERPISALSYLFAKYVLTSDYPPASVGLTVPARPAGPALIAAIEGCKCRVQIWLYPTKAELLQDVTLTKLEAEFANIAPIVPKYVEIHRVRDIHGWNIAHYRDSIHPTPDGMTLLGRAIADSL